MYPGVTTPYYLPYSKVCSGPLPLPLSRGLDSGKRIPGRRPAARLPAEDNGCDGQERAGCQSDRYRQAQGLRVQRVGERLQGDVLGVGPRLLIAPSHLLENIRQSCPTKIINICFSFERNFL